MTNKQPSEGVEREEFIEKFCIPSEWQPKYHSELKDDDIVYVLKPGTSVLDIYKWAVSLAEKERLRIARIVMENVKFTVDDEPTMKDEALVDGIRHRLLDLISINQAR